MSTNPKGKHNSDGTDFVKNVHDTYAFIDPTKQDLVGKHVLVTGASKGIGRATALSYAKAGASGIAIAARSDLSSLMTELERAAHSANRKAPKIVSVSMDVTSEASVRGAATEVQNVLGHLDIVIINAGAAEKFLPILEQDADAWWSTWQTNMLGPFLTLKSFMPMLIASPNDDRTIVALSSIGAHLTAHGASGYQCGKLALLRLMEFVNAEYGEHGMLAYAVHPGGKSCSIRRHLCDRKKSLQGLKAFFRQN